MSAIAYTARGAASDPTALSEGLGRCFSIAEASLSLSLSLLAGLPAGRSAAELRRRGLAAARPGREGRVGLSRALTARSVFTVSGYSPGAVLCCPGLPGGVLVNSSGRGWV